MSKSLSKIAVVLILSGALPLEARTLLDPPDYIKEEGAFVAGPSRVVGNVFAGLGAILASPFTAFSVSYAIMAQEDIFVEAGATVAVGAIAAGEIGYHLGAAPPYLIKKGLYEGPKALKESVFPPRIRSGLIAEVDADRRTPSALPFPFMREGHYSGRLAGTSDEDASVAAEEVPEGFAAVEEAPVADSSEGRDDADAAGAEDAASQWAEQAREAAGDSESLEQDPEVNP